MTKTGSLAPAEMNWPGPTLRATTVPDDRRIDRRIGADLPGLLELA